MDDDHQNEQSDLSKEVSAKEALKLRARKKGKRSVWAGLGMFGLVGWSVVVPALTGAWLGHWLDGRYPGVRSWTLTFLLAGLVLGCFNAWFWVQRENKDIHKELEDHDN